VVASIDWKPRIDLVYPLYERGFTRKKIAEQLGMHKSLAGYIVDIIEVSAHRAANPDMTISEMAQDLGMSLRAAREALRRCGVRVKPQKLVRDIVDPERARPTSDKWARGFPALDEQGVREMAQLRNDVLNSRIPDMPCVLHR
jgi:hypothetical protein